MLIRYCPRCAGRPFTQALGLINCPVCGSPLEMENVTGTAMAERAELDAVCGVSGSSDDSFFTPFFGAPDPLDLTDPAPEPAGVVTVPPTSAHARSINRRVETSIGTTIRGRMSQYSSSGREDGNYRRLPGRRLYQAIRYGQRFEDLCHTFTVRVQGGTDELGNQEYFDVPVNVHGTIQGGVQLADNNEVEVTGSYCKGVLMARKISVISNGYRTTVQFQRSVGLMVIAALALIAAIVGIYILADFSRGGAIWPSIVGFLKTWGTISAIIFVLYLMFCCSRFGFRLMMVLGCGFGSPIVTSLLLGLILAALFAAKFGTAANLLSLLFSLGPALLPSALALLLMLYFAFRLILPKNY